jgi:LCP family protein required for cell wall assembly
MTARPRSGRRALRQRVLLTFSSVAVVALLAAAGGLTYVYSKYSQLPRVELASALAETVPSGEPRNFLLVGVDSAAELDADDPARAGRDDLAGLRSDTMMVLRLDPKTDQAALLSFPRDLWVPLASGGNQRLNTAIQTGGPGELIKTIESNFGIPIHHYVQVDFAGFRDLVDVVDGVDVYFDAPARDSRSGLDVAETGCVTLDGEAALEYVRARHYQRYEDGRWRTDPSADLGRINRQQDFIVSALERAIERGVRNPVTLDRLVDAGLETVTVDDLLKAEDIVALGRALRSFDPGALELKTLPVRDGVVGGALILYLQEDEAQPILDQFRGTDVAALQPVDVRVQVLNGSGTAGQAVQTLDALTAAGFSTGGAGEADRFDFTESVVRYVEGGQAKAELVARYLDPAPQLELVPGPLDAEVVVVTGALNAGVLPTPRPAGPTTTQTTASTATTTTTLSLGDETTTTSVGFVPAAPPGVDC